MSYFLRFSIPRCFTEKFKNRRKYNFSGKFLGENFCHFKNPRFNNVSTFFGQKGVKMEEVWVQIEEFPRYDVSNLGRVGNNATGRIMKTNSTLDGTLKVSLVRDGKQHTRS